MAPDERESFRGLYREHYAALLAYCARRVDRDSAPDVTAEVFSVAWRRMDSMPDGDAALPWLYGVAAKTVANHRRTQRRRAHLMDKARRFADRENPSTEVQVIRRIEDAAVLEAISRMRRIDREVLLLSAWEELAAPAISTALDISVAAAEKRLARAKQRLAAELARADARLSHRDKSRETVT